MNEKEIWGTDGVVSMPVPMETTDTEMVDMQGFCFTPQGLRINLSVVEREELLQTGYGPSRRPGVTHE